MKGIQVHLGSGAKGKTPPFGKIAVVQFDRSPLPGAQVRAQRKACSAGSALASVEDFALQSLKTFVHGSFSA
jgi:hypothetical protein